MNINIMKKYKSTNKNVNNPVKLDNRFAMLNDTDNNSMDDSIDNNVETHNIKPTKNIDNTVDKHDIKPTTKNIYNIRQNEIKTNCKTEHKTQLCSDEPYPGDDMKLNTYWDVWIHENDNKSWSLESYKSIYEINSVGNMWRLLNMFNNFDKTTRQYYIMRKGITPIWEDNNNKKGGICSIMIENIKTYDTLNSNIGVDTFIALCILILNESFVVNNNIINGMCYSVKSRCVLIKLWIKDYDLNKNFKGKMPLSILEHIDSVLNEINNKHKNDKSNISIQYKHITPYT